MSPRAVDEKQKPAAPGSPGLGCADPPCGTSTEGCRPSWSSIRCSRFRRLRLGPPLRLAPEAHPPRSPQPPRARPLIIVRRASGCSDWLIISLPIHLAPCIRGSILFDGKSGFPALRRIAREALHRVRDTATNYFRLRRIPGAPGPIHSTVSGFFHRLDVEVDREPPGRRCAPSTHSSTSSRLAFDFLMRHIGRNEDEIAGISLRCKLQMVAPPHPGLALPRHR